jgi:hypothetical protein
LTRLVFASFQLVLQRRVFLIGTFEPCGSFRILHTVLGHRRRRNGAQGNRRCNFHYCSAAHLIPLRLDLDDAANMSPCDEAVFAGDSIVLYDLRQSPQDIGDLLELAGNESDAQPSRNPSALNNTISARQTCSSGALRSRTTAPSWRRSDGVTVMEIPVRMRQVRTNSAAQGSLSGIQMSDLIH